MSLNGESFLQNNFDPRQFVDPYFQKAKIIQRCKWAAQFIVVLLAIISLFLERNFVYLVAILAILIQFFIICCRYFLYQYCSTARDFNRLSRLNLAFGKTLDIDYSHLIKNVDTMILKKMKKVEDFESFDDRSKYSAESLRNSSKRFVFIIAEDVHFNASIFQKCFYLYACMTFIILLIPVNILLILIPFNDVGLAQIFVVFLSSVVATDLVSETLAWYQSSRMMREIDRDIYSLENSRCDFLANIFTKFCIADSMVPVVPDPVWNRYREPLNVSWRKKFASIEKFE